MVSLHLQHSILSSIRHSFLPTSSHQGRNVASGKRVSVLVKAEQVSQLQSASTSSVSFQDGMARRQLLAVGASVPPILLFTETPRSYFRSGTYPKSMPLIWFSVAAESKKGFLNVTDKKDGYSFLYPFGWQEVVIDGQDKVFKDVIEPLENVSVNMIPTGKQDIRDFGPPEQVAEALIKKVLAPSTQKTRLIQAKEQDVDGKAYYTFEFTAQAPNYIRHALGVICINNGKLYTLMTGAKERRWDKMKDRLFTIIDSFKVFNA
ncbi:hypothetical protein Cgig2_006050 [Carnegiea gigantea]|uniref:PsbP C-terminal domain-containing protein n=1 Tax=Carnegiea gigantea TaxID=171969 RepID=A0A9Q1L058_9CARY|nr:hypothetical protein Cgig2_006050 [Carnegiea gigantea]